MEIIAIALALAMDALAVSLATGLSLETLSGRQVFRMSWHFGLFQFLMPILGWLLGSAVSQYVADYSQWIVAGLLGALGVKMIWEALHNDEESDKGKALDPTRGWLLISLSIATSLDAMAVGISLAMMKVSIWLPCVVIGIVAGLLSMIGIRVGHAVGPRWGKAAEIFGGLILLGIASKNLL